MTEQLLNSTNVKLFTDVHNCHPSHVDFVHILVHLLTIPSLSVVMVKVAAFHHHPHSTLPTALCHFLLPLCPLSHILSLPSSINSCSIPLYLQLMPMSSLSHCSDTAVFCQFHDIISVSSKLQKVQFTSV